MVLDKITSEKIIEVGKIEYPMVVISDKRIEMELKRFFRIKRKVEEVIGKIFVQLGFSKFDFISLDEIKYTADGISFNYSVNGIKNVSNRISLKFANLLYENKMSINDINKCVVMNVSVYSNRNIGMKINEVKEITADGIYTRKYSYNSAEYGFLVDNREVILKLKVPMRCAKDFMTVNMEDELKNYFKKIKFPISIDALYKDISKFLGDVSLYSKVDLSIMDCNKNEVTDLLALNNGECSKFMITRGDRRVCLDSNGEWICNYSDEFCTVSTYQKDDDVTYSISASNDIVLHEQVFIHGVNGLENAMDEVDNTKKLVREMFPREDRCKWL